MQKPRIDKEVPSSKRQIETELHARLEAARVEYEGASEIYKQTLKRCDGLSKAHPSDKGNGQPHGTEESASESVSAQHHAFEKYQRALDDYNKFLVYGDLPAWP